MKFDLTDPTVPLALNIPLVISNVASILYNLPQMYRTYQTGSARDISGLFLLLRSYISTVWIIYGFYIDNSIIALTSFSSLVSSIYIGMYKIREIYVGLKAADPNGDRGQLIELAEPSVATV